MTLKHHFDAVPHIRDRLLPDLQNAEAHRIRHRAETLRQDYTTHAEKHRNHWAAQETNRIWLETQGRRKLEFRPGWAQATYLSLTREAQRRVDARIERKLQRIDRARDNMFNRLAQPKLQPHTAPSRADRLEQDVTRLIERAKRVRMEAAEHFRKHRTDWIRNAEHAGHQNPEAVVGRRQMERIRRIDRAQSNLMEQAFRSYRGDMPTLSQKKLTQVFNLER